MATPVIPVQRFIRWQLVKGASWFSEVIAARHGDLSHVDVITPGGWLRGAQSTTLGGAPRPGFWDRPQFYYKWQRRVVIELPVTDEQYRAFWSYSAVQIGKPYDNRGILSFATQHYAADRNWRDNAKWFCSEEQTANCEVAKMVHDLPAGVNHFDPGDFLTLLCGHPDHRILCDYRDDEANDPHCLPVGYEII